MQYLDDVELRKGLAVMHESGLFEIRVIASDKRTYSGYFRDAETAIRELHRMDLRGCNVYATLNELNPACYDREQRDRFVARPKSTTADGDVTKFRVMMVDIDPRRPSGTSSSEEELQAAKDVGNRIYTFMGRLGFSKPILAYSGNGVHLLYRVDLENNDSNKKLIKQCLQALDMLFSNKVVAVDTSNFNPARVCKLYGSLAQKGSNSADRPYRMARIISNSDMPITPIDYLGKLAGMMPKDPEKPQYYNHYNPQSFDLEAWMAKYGLHYIKTAYSDGTKYVLDHCPFDESHTGKDAAIFLSRGGAIGFHCFHASCADKTWRDVRVLFEPSAYEKKAQEQEQRMYHSYNRDRPKMEPKHIVQGDAPIFYSAEQILDLPAVEETFIRTGTTTIDKKLRGLRKGAVSVLSGLRGAAKSTWLSGLVLSAVQEGNNVGVFSGELSERNFLRWLLLQAAGKSRVEQGKYEGYYNVPEQYQRSIAQWLGDRFWLYNNNYGNNFKAILEQFEKVISEKSLDILILDNLMAFDISDLADSKWDGQTKFVWSLHDLAIKYNVHILFVAHPRKALGFLRLDDLSGTADLGNAVDNAFIIHRNNNDFKRLTKAMFGWAEDNDAYKGTNVIEIAKDRDGGTQDVFVPLWYENETKRLKNYPSENIIYGWDTEDGSAKKPVEYISNPITDDHTPDDSEFMHVSDADDLGFPIPFDL